jgi:hypothetical protein
MPPVSEVVATYVQLDATFADGAMRMLRSPFAQTTIALLRELFADGSTHRESEVLYAQMDAMLDELEFADCKVWRHTDGSRMDAREVVHETWVREFKLLERRILPTGESEHALRPEALAVLACADAIGNETITLSSPRVEMIVEALTRLSMVVNPDPAAQRADLVARVKEAQRALDEFDRKGGKLPPDLDPVAMYHNALDLMSQVPQDMSRIEEMMYEERNNLIDSFHEDDRSGGELVAEYLRRSDDLFSGTDSGQVYNGAIRMLSNRRLNAEITSRVRMICRSDALEDLEPQERMALERSWKHMVGGMHGILKLRRSCSETVSNAITQYDHEVYKAYTAKLKELYRVVLAHGLHGQPGARSPMTDALDNAEVETLMYKLSARADKREPPALFVGDPEGLPRIDLERLRYFGGARTAEVLDALEGVLPSQGEMPLSAAFNKIAGSLRREVELAGLMRYALMAGIPVEEAPRAAYSCVDLQGSERRWEAPDMMLVKKDVHDAKGRFDA